MNHNVKLAFLFSISQSIGRGVWMGNVLSVYIFAIAGNNPVILGWTSFATGITMTLVVFPTGFFVDKYRRDIVLKIASAVGVVALGFVLFGNDEIKFLVVALVLWGLFQGMNRPSLESILADSVESGKRSRVYSWLHLVRQISMAIGPFLNVGLFLIFGDDWSVQILKNVMIVGICITLFSLVIMLFFDDKKSLDTSSESIDLEMDHDHNDKRNGKHSRISSTALIAILLVGSNIIIGFGAGMTIKYFPIFFKEHESYRLDPILVQVIMGLTFIFTGLASLIAQKFSVKRGRVQIIFTVQFIATLCLFGIAFFPPIYILVPIFITRGALMNAAQPLSRSILMDVIPKKHRGKINSLEAFAWGFFWNFSALLGGYLIGSKPPYNFKLCFLVTACVYLVGIIPILFLTPLIGKEKIAEKEIQG